jgi:hypothetical protein
MYLLITILDAEKYVSMNIFHASTGVFLGNHVKHILDFEFTILGASLIVQRCQCFILILEEQLMSFRYIKLDALHLYS